MLGHRDSQDDSDHVSDFTDGKEYAGRHEEGPLWRHLHGLDDVICKEICSGGSTHGVEEVGCQGRTYEEPPRLILQKELEVLSHRHGGFASDMLSGEKEAQKEEHQTA